jgi:hypothetical protein
MNPDTFDPLATERLWPSPNAPAKLPARRIVFGAMSRAAAAFQRRLQSIKNPIERASLYMRNLHKFQSNS